MTAMKERFSTTELTALRNDLLQGGLIDSREAAELLQVFLMGRGYGVSPQAAMDAVGRVEMAGGPLPVLQQEVENLAFGVEIGDKICGGFETKLLPPGGLPDEPGQPARP